METPSQSPTPRKPTIDEIVDNTLASMALEGEPLTEEESLKVRERAVRELGPRLTTGPGKG